MLRLGPCWLLPTYPCVSLFTHKLERNTWQSVSHTEHTGLVRNSTAVDSMLLRRTWLHWWRANGFWQKALRWKRRLFNGTRPEPLPRVDVTKTEIDLGFTNGSKTSKMCPFLTVYWRPQCKVALIHLDAVRKKHAVCKMTLIYIRGSQPGVHVPVGYIFLSEGVHLRLAIEEKNSFTYSLFPNIYKCISEYYFLKSLYTYMLIVKYIRE